MNIFSRVRSGEAGSVAASNLTLGFGLIISSSYGENAWKWSNVPERGREKELAHCLGGAGGGRVGRLVPGIFLSLSFISLFLFFFRSF